MKYRIVFEDEEMESFVINGMSDIAVPIEVRVTAEPELIVTTYSEVTDEARAYCEKYSDEPFSDEAMAYLLKILEPTVRKWGYEPDRSMRGYICNYVADRTDDLNLSKILPQTCIVHTTDEFEKFENLTFRDCELDDDDPLDAAAVTVVGGKTVSFASVNDYYEETDAREINVETAPDFRHHGYAVSSVVCLARYLLEHGVRVKYNSRVSNTASASTAVNAGLRADGFTYSYVCYRD